MSDKQDDRNNESTEDLHRGLGDVTEPDSSARLENRIARTQEVPDRIGPFRILEILGEGGMGVVYLAEQTEPIRRRVALKLVKLGMDTKQVIARFESERQALALMNHPNVAKVFDAGATEAGRPYFVMEHVPGVPITEYCDQHRLNTTERLELFDQVCHAVQHAHQKGIIHRDIKPSNVLVSVATEGRRDGATKGWRDAAGKGRRGAGAVVKVIDFGVAKATQQRLTEKTLFTEQGQLIGTPEYMSPEQAEMTALDIDTRTDIYSLGVLLYELLTGALPFDPQSLRRAGFAEIQRIIREEEPPKPSTRLSSLGDESGAVAKKRRVDVSSLARQLRGDLDWITMKALDKDRTRRYASAAEFADDIARHLKHEPVLAGPPSTVYRLRKYVRRNRSVVLAEAAVVLTLLLGVIGTTYTSLWAMRALNRTIEAERQQGRLRVVAEANEQRAVDEAQLAEREAKTARQVTDFMVGLFEASDPSEAKGNSISAREILDRGVAKIRDELGDQPEVKGTLMVTMSTVYRALGLYDTALELARGGVRLRRQVFGDEHPDVATALNNLANVLVGKGDYEKAEALFWKSLGMQRKFLGDRHPDVAPSLFGLASVLQNKGDYDEAERLRYEAVGIVFKLPSDWRPGVADPESQTREALATRRGLYGDTHPNVAENLMDLGAVLESKGKYDEAERMYSKSLTMQRKLYGDTHKHTLTSMKYMGGLLNKLSRHHEAAELLRAGEAAARRVWIGGNARWLGGYLATMGDAHVGLAEYPAGEETLLEAYALLSASSGEDRKRTTKTVKRLITLYESWDAAEPGKGYAEKAAEWRAKLEKEGTKPRSDEGT